MLTADQLRRDAYIVETYRLEHGCNPTRRYVIACAEGLSNDFLARAQHMEEIGEMDERDRCLRMAIDYEEIARYHNRAHEAFLEEAHRVFTRPI